MVQITFPGGSTYAQFFVAASREFREWSLNSNFFHA